MATDILSRLPTRLIEQLQRWLPRFANALLLAGIAWLCYQLVLQFLPQDSQPAAPTSSTPVAIKALETAIPPARIADWHLFGESSASGEPDALTELPTTAPDTKLDLSLKGIVATSDKTQGYAIIQKPDKQEKHFKVSDSVFGLATLEEIYVDRVILQRNGRYETLRLPVEFLSGNPALERLRKKKIKQAVTDFRDKFLSRDVTELLKLFGFDTAYKNGGFIGFVVKALGEPGLEMMATLGVEDGDLITVVNGKRLSESLEAIDSLKDLQNAAAVDIIIERNGSEIPFHFDFEIPEGATVNEDGQIDQNTAVGTDAGSSTATSNSAGSSGTGSSAAISNSAGGAAAGNTTATRHPSGGATNSSSVGSTGTDSSTSGRSLSEYRESGESGEFLDGLGEDYGSTEEEQAYIEAQKARRTGINKAVEFDH